MTEQRISYPCPVRRLHVVWRNGEWSIDGETRVPSMTLPTSHELPAVAAVSGFWWEVVDREGGALHRRILSDPFASGMERFDEGGAISRVPAMAAPQEVAFDVTVPDVEEAVAIHFYSSTPPGSALRGEGAAERIAAIDVPPREAGTDGYR